MITTLNSLVKSNNVNLTNATSDYKLKIGEQAVITYSATNTIPLNISTEQGIYNLSVVGAINTASSSDGDIYLSANNTATWSTNWHVVYVSVGDNVSAGSATPIGYRATVQAFYLGGNGTLLNSTSQISTYTANKNVISTFCAVRPSSQYRESGWSSAMCRDTTSTWTSLGTIHFNTAQSGYIIINRIM